MMQRLRVLLLLAGSAISSASHPQVNSNQDRIAWVQQSLTRMLTIKPGMTREDLLRVFTTEGGISNRWQRRYVSRDCPLFKVDVEFVQTGDSTKSLAEDNHDVIGRISQPFLQYPIGD